MGDKRKYRGVCLESRFQQKWVWMILSF